MQDADEEGDSPFDRIEIYWPLPMLEVRLGARKYIITKTCLYNSDPFKPHFYIVKLGITRVYIIFLISAQNKDCGIVVRTTSPRRF